MAPGRGSGSTLRRLQLLSDPLLDERGLVEASREGAPSEGIVFLASALCGHLNLFDGLRYAKETAMSEPDEAIGLEQRSAERRKRLVVHRAASHEEAEAWDLEFWQQQTPEARLSTLVAIRRDVEVIEAGRKPPKGEER